MSINERRDLKRYELSAPATIECDPPGSQPGFLYLLTRNISGGGAFFLTEDPLRADQNVKVNICIDVGKLGELPLGGHVMLMAAGQVLRTEPFGMAVKFIEKCQVIPVS